MRFKIEKVGTCKYEVSGPGDEGTRVPSIIYSNEALLQGLADDEAVSQLVNVSMLPGIVKASLAMPDMHLGYGFPIGGVAAFKMEGGVISPGGVGYDINCGVRLIATNLNVSDVGPKIKMLLDTVYERIPSGVGRAGRLQMSNQKIENVLSDGIKYLISEGYGWDRDKERVEEEGSIKFSDRSKVSQKARDRGFQQLGSLGAGNHFLEVQVIDEIFDQEIAKKFGLIEKGQVTIMVHTGSRGFGHQVATDYLEIMGEAMRKYNISVPDRQLASAPLGTKEAEEYIGAMGAAANFGFSNRQIITHWIRESFKKIFGMDAEDLGMNIVYDVAHNIAKPEMHNVDGRQEMLVVHRKGATRAFPGGRPEISGIYKDIGHPVIIPGTMGTSSYVLIGTPIALDETFGSTCHGSGRVMSRNRAVKQYTESFIKNELEKRGIYVRASTRYVLQEEAPWAYKDVSEVVKSVECAGLSHTVARFRPIGVMKG
ncbi:MAG: RtcB family protein [Thermoplasmatales archaeon]